MNNSQKQFHLTPAKIASVLTGKGFFNTIEKTVAAIFLPVILIFLSLSVYKHTNSEIYAWVCFIGCGVLFLSLFWVIIHKQKKIWEYEAVSNYKRALVETHENIQNYINEKINDDSLIADPVFMMSCDISQPQFMKMVQGDKAGRISYKKLKEYKGTINHPKFMSSFMLIAICFLEHSLVIVSQISYTNNSSDNNARAVEVKYHNMNYEVSQTKIRLEDIVIEPINTNVLTKLDVILETLKPYIA